MWLTFATFDQACVASSAPENGCNESPAGTVLVAVVLGNYSAQPGACGRGTQEPI